MPRLLPALAPLLLCSLSSCVDREVTTLIASPDSVEVKSIPATTNRELDILFVIDNSGSMTQEHMALVRDFPRMLAHLAVFDGGLPDIHIGVVTPDLGTAPYPRANCDGGGGDGGRLHGGACAALGGNSFLSDVRDASGGRVRNYTGSLEAAFSCMANVGTTGCGFEQHLAAMEKALTPTINPGFIRPDAVLAVVIIADEDDCSASNPIVFARAEQLGDWECHPRGIVCDDDPDPAAPGIKTNCRPDDSSPFMTRVDHYVEALTRLKGDPTKIALVGIIGDPDDVEVGVVNGDPAVLAKCPTGGLGTSEPGLRFAAFFDKFPAAQVSVDSLCTADLSAALERAGIVISDRVGFACLDHALADRNPTLPDVQPECSVLQRAGTETTVLPACAAGAARPCWSVAPDLQNCRASDHHQRITIERDVAAPPEATLSIQCAVE